MAALSAIMKTTAARLSGAAPSFWADVPLAERFVKARTARKIGRAGEIRQMGMTDETT